MLVWGLIWGLLSWLFWDGGRLTRFGSEPLLSQLLWWLAFAWSLRWAIRREWLCWTREQSNQQAAEHRLEQPPLVPPLAPDAAPAFESASPTELATTQVAPSAVDAVPARSGRLLAQQAAARSASPSARPASAASARVWSGWLFSGNMVARLGVLLLFVGLAFLAKYAAQAGLLPPALRIASIGLVGVALFVAGWLVHGRARGAKGGAHRLAWAQTLQGGGIAVLYLAVFAAFRLYDLLPTGAAFALLVVISALAAAVALLQNSYALALIGFAGAYVAPLLAGSGDGGFPTLLRYYLLLNVAVVAIGYWRSWRLLQLLGMLLSFAMLATWLRTSYEAAAYGTAQSILLAYFAVFVGASVLELRRHGEQRDQPLHTALFFGLPLAAMGIQVKLLAGQELTLAFACLGYAVVYVILAQWAARQRNRSSRWLQEGALLLALALATAAVPLALGAQWTVALWALEAWVVYAWAQRQGRVLGRVAGLALLLLAVVAFAVKQQAVAQGSILHPALLGMLALTLACWGLTYHLLRQAPEEADGQSAGSGTIWQRLQRQFERLEPHLAPVTFALGLGWAIGALKTQLGFVTQRGGWAVWPWPEAWYDGLMLLGIALLSLALHYWARPERQRPLAAAAWVSGLVLPLWLVLEAIGGLNSRHYFGLALGVLVWPVALAVLVYTLYRLDGSSTGAKQGQTRWAWVHGSVLVLLLVQTMQLLRAALWQAGLASSVWRWVLPLLVLSGFAWLLTRPSWFRQMKQPSGAWPLRLYGQVYVRYGAWTVMLLVWLGTLWLVLHSAGAAAPLPYLPVFNPTDISALLALVVMVGVLQRWRQYLHEPQDLCVWRWSWAGLGFVVLNTVWLRVAHQYWAVAWDWLAMYRSGVAQAGLSILWALLAFACMWLGSRRQRRELWWAGALLLGLTTVKLLLLDLSHSGGLERIVSFIAVGVLMLILGYVAPMPKRKQEA